LSSFSAEDLIESGSEGSGESARLGSLHSDLNSLEGTKEAVSNNFSRTRSDRPADSSVVSVSFLTC